MCRFGVNYFRFSNSKNFVLQSIFPTVILRFISLLYFNIYEGG